LARTAAECRSRLTASDTATYRNEPLSTAAASALASALNFYIIIIIIIIIIVLII